MAIHLGDFPTSHTAVCLPFASFAASTGASSATSNFASSDILVYKDGGTTQRSSASGITVSTSFDSQTGLNLIVIDLSDNADAGFYAAGHEYQVGVADVTIDAQTVRFWAGTFSIERAGGILALLKATGSVKVDVNKWLSTTVSTPTVAGVPNVNTKTWNDLATVALPLIPTTAGRTLDVSATGEAGVDWANVGSPTTTVGLSGTTVKTATDVETDTQDLQASFAALATPATMAAAVFDEASSGHTTAGTYGKAISDILVDTGTTLDGRIPAALVSGRIDASVGAMAANTMTAAAAASDLTTELQSGLATSASIAALNNLSAATVLTQVNTALTTTIADSVPTDGTRPSVAQGIYGIYQFLTERSITSTTMTVAKPDGTTALMTFTLNSATTPTSITRAT